MRHLLTILMVCALVLTASGCGNVFIRGTLGGSNTVQSMSGFIGVVQFTSATNNGVLIVVTLVTFLQNGTADTVTFCGDQRGQFPLNQFVSTKFTPGPPCANILTIVIGIN